MSAFVCGSMVTLMGANLLQALKDRAYCTASQDTF